MRVDTLALMPPVPDYIMVSNGMRCQRIMTELLTESNHHHGSSESTQSSAVLNRKRQGGDEEDDESNNVDDSEDGDGLVSAQVLIGHDGANDGCDIAPELPEILQSGGE